MKGLHLRSVLGGMERVAKPSREDLAHLCEIDGISYAILAGCFPRRQEASEPLHGRLLSIFDRSDQVASSCRDRFEQRSSPQEPIEIVLDQELGHALFYLPDESWIGPLLEWLG